jgi:uncharacterized membrane protein
MRVPWSILPLSLLLGGCSRAALVPEGSEPSWLLLLVGAVGFPLFHLLLSSDSLRPAVVGRVGEQGFLGIYSLLALASMSALVTGWMRAPYEELWNLGRSAHWIALVLMPIPVILLTAGASTRSPTAMQQEDALAAEDPVRGILRITRHPVNMGMATWAALHLLANGDLASVLAFGSLLALSVLGSMHIDRRRARSHGERWGSFAAKTSLLPFGAIVAGRNRLRLGEIGGGRLAAGLVVYAVIVLLHGWFAGVSAIP